MSGKMSELDQHLFAALDRLDNDNLTPEQIEAEVKRAGAIVSISDQIIEGAKVKLTAARLYAEHRDAVLPYLPQIGKASE